MINIPDGLLKQFGQSLQSASILEEYNPQIIPATPKIDSIIGGGIPEGSFVVITGKPALGKSSLALQIAANAQKTPYIDTEGKEHTRPIFYFDIEARIKKRDIFDNKRLNLHPDHFRLVRSSNDNIIIGEDFLSIGEKLIHTCPGAIFIFDSFSSVCTRERLKEDVGKKVRDDAPLLLSNFCKRISQVLSVNKSLVIGITHIIANQGFGSSNWVEASGQKIQYQADVKLNGLYFQEWLHQEDRIGQIVHWQCSKSALGPPGGKTESYLRYGYGYDERTEYLEIAIDLGIIVKKGAWYEIEGKKIQGMENCVIYLEENPEIYKDIVDKIRGTYIAS